MEKNNYNIERVEFYYNGDNEKFDRFLSSAIKEYISTDILARKSGAWVYYCGVYETKIAWNAWSRAICREVCAAANAALAVEMRKHRWDTSLYFQPRDENCQGAKPIASIGKTSCAAQKRPNRPLNILKSATAAPKCSKICVFKNWLQERLLAMKRKSNGSWNPSRIFSAATIHTSGWTAAVWETQKPTKHCQDKLKQSVSNSNFRLTSSETADGITVTVNEITKFDQ